MPSEDLKKGIVEQPNSFLLPSLRPFRALRLVSCGYRFGMISLAQISKCSISSNIGLNTICCAPAFTIP